MTTKGIIFDLDNTLIASDITKKDRDCRKWQIVYNKISQYKVDVLIVEMIKRLKSRDVKICIVSNSPEEYCKCVINYMGIEVDYVIGYYDVIDHKPNPEAIYLACALMGHPNVIVGVGDDANDIAAYKEAGIHSVQVSYYTDKRTGCRTIKELLSEINNILFILSD